jgi:hypothetical protein
LALTASASSPRYLATPIGEIMSFFQKIKEFFMGSSEPEIPQPEYHPQHVATKNIKVQEFVDGRREKLSTKDVFPDMKVFEPVKTPKNPSFEDIQSRLNNAKKSIPLPAGYKDACICIYWFDWFISISSFRIAQNMPNNLLFVQRDLRGDIRK